MKKIIAIIVLACFMLPQVAFGGAWTLPKNNIYLEWYQRWGWANKYFDKHGNLSRPGTNPRSWQWTMAPYVEYGVTDWFTLLGKIEYGEAWYKEYSRPFNWGPYVRKNHGINEITFGGKARILKKPAVVSIQLLGRIDPKRGYDINEREPMLGDECDSIELKGLIGKKWDTKIPFYLGLESGYEWCNRDVPNFIPLFAEGGFWANKWLLIKSELDCRFSHPGTGAYAKDYAYIRMGPTIQLLQFLYGNKKGPSGPPGSELGNDVTRQGRSFDIGVFYGNCFWGRNTQGEQQVILKVSAQY